MVAGGLPPKATRLLFVTGLWPTNDRPAAGVFVSRRAENLDAVVVGPDRYDTPMPVRYLRIAARALTTRGPFDGVEGHVLLPAGVIALVAARLRRIPLVVYAHGADVRVTANENPVYRWLASVVARHADAVVTNSEATARLVRHLGAEAEVIPPGVDLSVFKPSPRPIRSRILYMGGSEARKGFEVARHLADTVVGPGIKLIPPVDVPALMAEHDVVLVPSSAEPYGLVAAEAIAAGRWVVAAAVDGLSEIVVDGRNGTLVEDGNYESALASVPNYDPFVVASTAGQFSLVVSQERMAALWRRVLQAPIRRGMRR